MTIEVGQTLPDATFIVLGPDGPEPKSTTDLFSGRKVALFAVPGAYTPTCSLNHLPSFVKNAEALKAKGVDAIACVSVNDPFVMKAWGESSGAMEAGIHMLADPEGAFTQAVGMDFSAPPVGLIGRSKRYSMLVEDGKVTALNVEESPGEAKVSTGDAMLEAL
ncbi:MAG TPA: peroxiredoxin [Paracoccaceae bacterium]|nr:peroxiredoxin [Paracoccaceae bacterium]